MNVTFWAPEGNIVQMECPLGIQFYFSFLMSKIANHKIVTQTFMLDDSNLTSSTLIGNIIRPLEGAQKEISMGDNNPLYTIDQWPCLFL